ncbi:hypothetical protein BKA56DRAFT_87135 [Ilyonectria sp. MPI-CAGE-AT-0026]|nr:hypothetical protein BKA56DRAFT_87135 [Ilyonectria sp. MPI-CAGE-AT-0026]
MAAISKLGRRERQGRTTQEREAEGADRGLVLREGITGNNGGSIVVLLFTPSARTYTRLPWFGCSPRSVSSSPIPMTKNPATNTTQLCKARHNLPRSGVRSVRGNQLCALVCRWRSFPPQILVLVPQWSPVPQADGLEANDSSPETPPCALWPGG